MRLVRYPNMSGTLISTGHLQTAISRERRNRFQKFKNPRKGYEEQRPTNAAPTTLGARLALGAADKPAVVRTAPADKRTHGRPV